MSGDDYQRQVSVALHDLVDEPGRSTPMFERVADRVRRRRRRRLAGTAAAVVAVAALATRGFLMRANGDTASVTVAAASCPDMNGDLPSDSRHASDLSHTLVPGRPVLATVCRYHGYQQLETLGGTATIRGTSVASLAAALNAGKKIPEGARYHCPAYDPGSFRVIFGYRNGDVVTVRAELGYCRMASNGTTGRFTSQQAAQQLTELLGKDS